jgi:hypothetical protein
MFLDLKEIILESFNISENNIISDELAKVLGYSYFEEVSEYSLMSSINVSLLCPVQFYKNI